MPPIFLHITKLALFVTLLSIIVNAAQFKASYTVQKKRDRERVTHEEKKEANFIDFSTLLEHIIIQKIKPPTIPISHISLLYMHKA